MGVVHQYKIDDAEAVSDLETAQILKTKYDDKHPFRFYKFVAAQKMFDTASNTFIRDSNVLFDHAKIELTEKEDTQDKAAYFTVDADALRIVAPDVWKRFQENTKNIPYTVIDDAQQGLSDPRP